MHNLRILIDGVFFQLNNTGITRVWTALFKEWVANGFAKHIIVLDRVGTAPKIPGIKYRTIPTYDYSSTEQDRRMLQQVCDQEEATLFISTYYTTPISTPSVFMGYDMIPEAIGQYLDAHMWKEKHHGINHASAYITISESTARDLVKFFPNITAYSIAVAHCGIDRNFLPATIGEIENFKSSFGIHKPYFLLVGDRISWMGYKNATLFFQAFALLEGNDRFEIVCVGGRPQLEESLKTYKGDNVVHLLRLTDEELICAYSAAVALVYPSKYEGFGLPLLEAMACHCPVITCPNSSIPEVVGSAAVFVEDSDIKGMVRALSDVQKPEVRQTLIEAGAKQIEKFSWTKMAEKVSSALIKVAEKSYWTLD